MKADTVDLAAIFGNQVRYMVPLFQRPYVWSREDQWEPLWQDIQSVADRQLDDTPSNDEIPHFLGAVVLEQALVQSGKIHTRSVVDGQQRLTTLQLLLAAARAVAAEHQLDDARKTFEKLLFNESFLVKHDSYQFKVLPTERDRAAFREAMHDGVAAATGGHRMHEAFRYFRDAIKAWVAETSDASTTAERVEVLSTVLWKLVVVVTIDLDPGDNAQIIFETLNARGTPLLAGDLIKNHLFQVATIQGAAIDELYNEHWRLLDTDWWRDEVRQGRLRRPRLDVFLNHWLAMRTGSEVVSHELFPAFKRYLADGGKAAEEVLGDLKRYAEVYESFEKEAPATDLGRFLYRLGIMEVTTAYPAMLWLLGPEGIDDPAERKTALDAIESWLVRRLLTRMTTKNYNVVFLALLKAVRSGRGDHARGQDVVDFLAGLAGESQVWPTDDGVLSALRGLPVYTVLTRSRLRMVLEALEEASYTGLTEKVILPHDLTIEHVLPQEWTMHWPLPETDDPTLARARRDAAKHTIGNLTLVTGKLNPTLSNAAWETKRSALSTHSVLLISADLKQADTWDEASIAERGEKLARTAITLWPRPAARVDVSAPSHHQEVASEARMPRVAPTSAATSVATALPDEEAFASVLTVADDVGVGEELRRIVSVSRELGLHPRPYRYSVMVSPPTDKRAFLFTLWPQAQEGGSFRIWSSASAFARFFPGLDLSEAQAELGTIEGPGVLQARDVARLLDSLRRLVASYDGREPLGEVVESEDDNASSAALPVDLESLIEMRASPTTARLARSFAHESLRTDGVVLRVQGGKGDPWYFQVRHPRFSQVVAYVSPRQSELHIDYRLPPDYETYGVAQSRDNFYGIAFKAKVPSDLDIALRLLRDALARPE